MPLQPLGVYQYPSNRGFNVRGQARGASIVYHQQWVDPIAVVTNGILTTLAGPNTTTLTLTPGAGLNGSLVSGTRLVLDFARNVVITVTHGTAVVAESGVITGKDVYGRDMTEAWSVTAGGTTKTFTGKKAFKTITQITITAVADASANSNIIGNGNVLGLDVNSALGVAGGAVKEIVAAALVTTGTLVAKSTAATDDPRGTYLPASAPDGSRDYDLWYVSDDPEFSS